MTKLADSEPAGASAQRSDGIEKMLDLVCVRYAIIVAEHLSIRGAAAQMNLQPSAVSRRITTLEQQLGITLFERRRSGVQPTLACLRFLDRARWALSELDEAARSSARMQKEQFGALGIGFYASLASGRLHQILAEYRARFPILEFTFREGASADQLAALRQHQIDVAFLVAVDDASGLPSEHLWDERMYVAVPSRHAAATREALTWAELRGEAFVVRTFGSGPFIYAWLAGKLHPGDYAPNISQYDMCRDSSLGLVSAGYGLTVVAESATAITIPGVVYLPIVDDDAIVSVRMAWLNGNENPALGPFLSHSRRVARAGSKRP